MKRILLAIITVLAVNNCIAQLSDRTIKDSNTPGETPIEMNQFKEIISSSFSKVLTGQNTASPGRFATMDIQKAEVTFAPSFALGNRDIITVNFKGGITEGIASVFNNSKLNTNLSLQVQYHLLISKKSTSSDITLDLDSYSKSTIELIKTRIEIFETYHRIFTASGIIDPTGNINNANISIVALKGQNLESFSIDNLDAELNNVQGYIDTIINNMPLLPPNLRTQFNKLRRINNNKYLKKQQELLEKSTVTSFKLDWFSFSGKIKNDEFRLFYPLEDFNEQIDKTNYVSGEFGTQFSHYRFSEHENSLYYAIALNYGIKSNYSDLEKKNITEKTLLDSQNESERESNESFVAYTGDYKKDLNEIKVASDIYYFFDALDRFGLHAYHLSKFTQYVKPLHDLGFGLILPFKDQTNEKSIINAEIYYTIKNLFNSNNLRYSIVERNEIGLRFTFPINF